MPTRKAIDANPVLVALMQWGDAHAAPDGPPRVLVHAALRARRRARAAAARTASRRSGPESCACAPGAGANERQRAEPMLPLRG